jgi:hypothetical protein
MRLGAQSCGRRRGRRLLLCFACVWSLGCAEQPAPGGPAGPLVINRLAPAVTSISPIGVVAGSPSVTLVISGYNFADDAVVTFGSQTFKPQALTGSQITVSIPSSLLVQAGTRAVAVTNPAPGGGTTYALTPFQVLTPPLPPYQQDSTITPPNTSGSGGNPYPGPANPAYGQFPSGGPGGTPPYGQFPDGGPGGAPPFGTMPNGTNTTPRPPSQN